jgi:predicted membrane-bound mannosyltransferase
MEALHNRWQFATRILGTVVLLYLYVQAWRASVTYASNPRNPWAYAHTGPDVFTIRDRVEEFAHAAADPQNVTVDVYSRANLWPLPWYLRRIRNVRWWRQVVIPGRAAPIVLVSPEMEPELARKLYEGPPPGERELYMNMFKVPVELRPQVAIRGYVAKSLWDRREQSR